MRTITTNVYTFDELSKDAKKKAIDDNRYTNVDNFYWYRCDGLLDPSPELRRSRRISDYEYCLAIGDGCLFEYDHREIEFSIDDRYLKLNGLSVRENKQADEVFRKLLRVPVYLWKKVDYYFYHSNRSTTIGFRNPENYEPCENDGYTAKEIEILERAINIFDGIIKEGLNNLKNNYEYFTSDEEVAETLIANDYEFTEEGKKV